MRKIFVLLAMILPLCVNANGVVTLDGLTEPDWSDFAPSMFANVNEPKGIGKLNETASYWYKRRVQFEEGINECRLLSDTDSKMACYQQLKVKQYQLNSDYNARIEAQEQMRMGPQEMFDKTDTMLPINGYFNNFTRFQPNELRGF